jgi:hypothetical protein
VEGAPRAASGDDAGDDPVQVAQDLACGDAEGFEAVAIHAGVADDVTGGAVATVVRLAVDLYDQPGGQAGEVEAVALLRVLAAELEVARSLAELLPEQDFGERHLLPISATFLYVLDRRAEDLRLAWAPSTTR